MNKFRSISHIPFFLFVFLISPLALSATTLTFSSYTQGLFEVTSIKKEAETVCLNIHVPLKIQDDFPPNQIGINGVLASYKPISSNSLTALVSKENFNNSSLSSKKAGDLVSIGFLSDDPNDWLLGTVPSGTVRLIALGDAPYPEYTEEFSFDPTTEEFTFECSPEQYEALSNNIYLGLNGSGFMLQDHQRVNDRCSFSVHAGIETRQVSEFSRDKIKIGAICTLSLPLSKKI